MTPVIIEAAINGITNKARNPHVPCTPAEITADALACLTGGAAIVHNHVDVMSDGAAVAARQLEGWRPLLAEAVRMRMSVFDPGSVNLGGVADDGLPGGAFDFVYTNSFGDIRHMAALCDTHGLGPSISIFEPGFLRATLAYHRAGRLPAGAFVKFYFGGDADYLGGRGKGVGFGLPPTRAALDAYLEMLDGSGLPWAVAVIGGDVVGSGLARAALERGGHIRVGLEDYAGPRQPRNVELVKEAVDLARAAGRAVASCAEASAILHLPRG